MCGGENDVEISNTTAVVKSGYLHYFKKGWKLHFVQLHEDSMLVWRKKQGDRKTTGRVMLKNVCNFLALGPYTKDIPGRPKLPDQQAEGRLIAIPCVASQKAKQIYWFLFASNEELSAWMTAICGVLPPPPVNYQQGGVQQQQQQQQQQIQRGGPGEVPQPYTGPGQPAQQYPSQGMQYPQPGQGPGGGNQAPQQHYPQQQQHYPPQQQQHYPQQQQHYPQQQHPYNNQVAPAAPAPAAHTVVIHEDTRGGIMRDGNFAMGMVMGYGMASPWGWGWGGGWGYHGWGYHGYHGLGYPGLGYYGGGDILF